MPACSHPTFTTVVNVVRSQEGGIVGGRYEYRAELQIACEACGEPFRFAASVPDETGLRLYVALRPATGLATLHTPDPRPPAPEEALPPAQRRPGSWKPQPTS